MPPITKTKTVTAGYGCDMCGVMISDGESDGLGGINWWGFSFIFSLDNQEQLTVTREWDRVVVSKSHNIDINHAGNRRWMVCKDCAAKIELFIAQNTTIETESSDLDYIDQD